MGKESRWSVQFLLFAFYAIARCCIAINLLRDPVCARPGGPRTTQAGLNRRSSLFADNHHPHLPSCSPLAERTRRARLSEGAREVTRCWGVIEILVALSFTSFFTPVLASQQLTQARSGDCLTRVRGHLKTRKPAKPSVDSTVKEPSNQPQNSGRNALPHENIRQAGRWRKKNRHTKWEGNEKMATEPTILH